MIKLNTNKILIPIDFSATSLNAIRHGAFLAKRNKGELFLLHVKDRKDIITFGSPTEQLRQLANDKKELLAQTRQLAQEVSKEYNIPVTPLIVTGKCPSEIVKVAEKHHAGLIVMGTRGSESTSSLFFGSNALRVISRSSIPVITVRKPGGRLGYPKILLPVDSSEHSRQKVVSAIQLAKLFASTVHVLGILAGDEEAYRYKMEVILKQIRKKVEAKNLVFASDIVVTDEPANFTMAYARKMKADIIVTMTDQNTGSTRLVSGTFDQQLVDESDIPVMSIQPEVPEENLSTVSVGGMW